MRELACRHHGDPVLVRAFDREIDRDDPRDLAETEPRVEAHRRPLILHGGGPRDRAQMTTRDALVVESHEVRAV